MVRKVAGVTIIFIGIILTGFSIHLLFEGIIEAIFIGIVGGGLIISGSVLMTKGVRRFFEAFMDLLGF